MNAVFNSLYLAWTDNKTRYRNSLLGPFWPTITTLMTVTALSFIWGHLLKESSEEYIPHLAIGLILWQLISGIIVDSPTLFIRNAQVIKNVVLPNWFFTIRVLFRHLTNFIHNAFIIIGVLLYCNIPLKHEMLFFFPYLLLALLILFFLSHSIGLLGARFRDMEPLISGVVPLLFLISPIIYTAERLPLGFNIVWANPFTYLLESLRCSLTGGQTPDITNVVLMLMLGALIALAVLLEHSIGKKIAFWV